VTRIVFKRDFEGYKAGNEYDVERTLASRIMDRGIAISYTDHLAELQKAADAKAKAKKVAAEKKAAEEKAAAEKKARLLKEKEESNSDKADSKTAKKRTRAVRKR